MATSVSRIHAQIAKLQQQADALKQAAVKRVQREIELHGLTAEDLFSSGTTKAKRTAGAKGARAAKYGDSAGNTWGGMGKRPQWLRDALDQGASIEDFLLGTTKASKPTKAVPARKAKTASKTTAKKVARQPRRAKNVEVQSPAKKAGAKRGLKRATAQPEAAAAD
jgi:DNA-binding protein H-NS